MLVSYLHSEHETLLSEYSKTKLFFGTTSSIIMKLSNKLTHYIHIRRSRW